MSKNIYQMTLPEVNKELDRLYARQHAMECTCLYEMSEDERREKVATCEVVIVAATPLRKPVIEAAKRIELVHHQGVGWQDTTDHAELKQRGIPLALTPDGTTTGVAEHTVLLILAALKLLPYADSELRLQ